MHNKSRVYVAILLLLVMTLGTILFSRAQKSVAQHATSDADDMQIDPHESLRMFNNNYYFRDTANEARRDLIGIICLVANFKEMAQQQADATFLCYARLYALETRLGKRSAAQFYFAEAAKWYALQTSTSRPAALTEQAAMDVVTVADNAATNGLPPAYFEVALAGGGPNQRPARPPPNLYPGERWVGASTRPVVSEIAHVGLVLSMAFTPDGLRLATAGEDGTIKIWSLPQRSLVATLRNHVAAARSIAISRDGRMLAAGFRDKSIGLWSLSDYSAIAMVRAHDDEVEAVAFSADGRTLTSASRDQTVKRWSIPQLALKSTQHYEAFDLSVVSLSPDGGLLAASGVGQRKATVWAADSGRLLTTLQADDFGDLAISPDSKFLLSGGADRIIRQWSLPDGKMLSTFQPQPSISAGRLVLSPDGKLIEVCGFAKTGSPPILELLSLVDGKPKSSFSGPWIDAGAFPADGRTVALADRDGHVTIRDVATAQPVWVVQDPDIN